MLWTIVVILLVLWLLGFLGHVGGGLIHLLIVIAVIIVISVAETSVSFPCFGSTCAVYVTGHGHRRSSEETAAAILKLFTDRQRQRRAE